MECGPNTSGAFQHGYAARMDAVMLNGKRSLHADAVVFFSVLWRIVGQPGKVTGPGGLPAE
jgi:hypothetical protein